MLPGLALQYEQYTVLDRSSADGHLKILTMSDITSLRHRDVKCIVSTFGHSSSPRFHGRILAVRHDPVHLAHWDCVLKDGGCAGPLLSPGKENVHKVKSLASIVTHFSLM